MSLFGRSKVFSCLRLLYFNQPLCQMSILKCQAAPVCFMCIQSQAKQFLSSVIQKRLQHTSSFTSLQDISAWQRMKWNMGFYGKLQVSRKQLDFASYNLYICCTDLIDVAEYIKVLKLPDTFNTWFLLLQLHLWMVNVKLSQMGKEGAVLKTCIYKSMWHNIDARLQKFQDVGSKERREALELYQSLMYQSILYYDEGLLGSDKTLASSLWVLLFSMDPNVATDKLELMVKYVRKQVQHHDGLEPHPIMTPGYISFLPLLEDKLDQNKSNQDLQYLLDLQR